MIVFSDLSFNRGQRTILNSVSLRVEKGCITILTGPSGSGKTTLLRCAVGLEQGYTGSIFVDGKDIRSLSAQERAQTVGFVFQDFNLFSHMSVLDNCVSPLLNMGVSLDEAKMRVRALLKTFSMEEFERAKPATLSGGQKQRVAIARALALRPQVLLLDEPTSALDPQLVGCLEELLKELCQQGLTVLVSSQDMGFVNSLIARSVVLDTTPVIARSVVLDTTKQSLLCRNDVGLRPPPSF